MSYAVEMRGIRKTFPGVVANDFIDFSVERGTICGLVGENGAGKTTLMKILYGMYRPDAGTLYINGEEAKFNSPKDAITLHIGMVHQHFTLVPSMTVAENIMYGRPIRKKSGLLDLKKASEVIRTLSDEYAFDLNPDAVTADLPVGVKQRIEILKALYLGAEILIMDEPTAVLTPQEIQKLFNILRILKGKGCTIILITHKLREIMEITDDVTVMRNGKVTGHVKTCDTNELELARMMVERDVLLRVPKEEAKPGEIEMKAEHLSYTNDEGVKVVDDVNFCVRRGEIVGIAGVQGNGQTELIEMISGLITKYTGELMIGGQKLSSNASPIKRRNLGLGHIPEDRQTTGAALEATLLDNYTMTNYLRPEFQKHHIIQYKKLKKATEDAIEKFRVKTPSINEYAFSLSGGNLQKLIAAREILMKPKFLMACQPTRGVDIGAMEFIHQQIVAMRDAGSAVLLVSNELSEIMSLSDRILVMFRGRFVGEIDAKLATEEQLGRWMAGIVDKKPEERDSL